MMDQRASLVKNCTQRRVRGIQWPSGKPVQHDPYEEMTQGEMNEITLREHLNDLLDAEMEERL